MSDAVSLGPGGTRCSVFEAFAFLIKTACWRREYLGGAQRLVFVLKRGRKGFGWPWALGSLAADPDTLEVDVGLGMGAR